MINNQTETNVSFEKISEKIAYDGRRKIVKKEFLLPNGEVHEFDIFKRPLGTAVIVAITDTGKLIIEKQYRVGPEKILVELPAGAIESGELPEEGARRELLEETGYISENIELMGRFYQGGYSDHELYIFLATNCKFTGNASLDHTEFIEVSEVDIDEYRSYIKQNVVFESDALGFYLAMEKLGKTF